MNIQTKNTLLVAIISTLIGIGVGYFVGDNNTADYGRHRADNPSRHMMDMNKIGTNDTSLPAPLPHDLHSMTVESEREFLDQMIPHHQEAVDTAKQVLARGATTPDIMNLTEAIITAQESEISKMKSWYLAWYGEEYQQTTSYQPMMRDLLPLSGKELDRAFLEDMIMHHIGAIMMAQSVTLHLEHQEMVALAETIIETQNAEIELMSRFLETL